MLRFPELFPLSSVCPKPAACPVVCSPVFPFLDTLSNTDVVPFHDSPIYLFFVSALFCLHEPEVAFLEKPNTSVFFFFFGTVILCVYICQLFLFPSTDMKAPGECFLSCQGLYV